MFQGTGSGVGKSFIAAAFCRILKRKGYRVAPFKAQNMALNSFVTVEGGEIGRAQALQAEAAGVEPSVYMNPVLLKASGEKGAQVILLGKVHSTMTAMDYYSFRDRAWEAVLLGWQKLSKNYDVIVIEGAGSPAEINLMDKEIVNMAVAKLTGASVILIGDIDRGGVFASLYGTVKLLEDDARYIKGFIINKFRGDVEILKPGNRLIEQKTGIPVLGVLPYISRTGLPEEDGLSLNYNFNGRIQKEEVKITVLRLPYISNFTDFDPFLFEPGVSLIYSLRAEDILNSDMVIIPGTKNTTRDLMYLKEHGIERVIRDAISKGISVIGICGGYQMMGSVIKDPGLVEGTEKEVRGLGILETETLFEEPKITSQVRAVVKDRAFPFDVDTQELRGYEIHMGRSIGKIGLFQVRRIPSDEMLEDGAKSGICWGTYLHGIFDNDRFRWALINHLREKRGLKPAENLIEYQQYINTAIDRFADTVMEYVDVDYILGLLETNSDR